MPALYARGRQVFDRLFVPSGFEKEDRDVVPGPLGYRVAEPKRELEVIAALLPHAQVLTRGQLEIRMLPHVKHAM